MPKTLERALNAQAIPKLTESGTATRTAHGLALKVDVKGNKPLGLARAGERQGGHAGLG